MNDTKFNGLHYCIECEKFLGTNVEICPVDSTHTVGLVLGKFDSAEEAEKFKGMI